MMIINTLKMCASLTTSQRRFLLHKKKLYFSASQNEKFLIFFFSLFTGFLKLIFFISIIFVILLIIIASIIYIWVIRRFSTNLEQVNRGRLPEVNHNLLNHSSIQDFEALVRFIIVKFITHMQ